MGKDKRVLLVTEANERVASGHLLESAELARYLTENDYLVDVAVNDDACDAFKQRIGQKYYEYHESVDSDMDFFRARMQDNAYSVIITDLREVRDEWIKSTRNFTSAVIICIDEWGQRTLSSDVIINPMIDPYFWDYKDSKAKIYAGHEYLILPEKIVQYHNRERKISEVIKRVCISMGGVDKFGTTVKLVKWLIRKQPGLEMDVILGGGFLFKEELENIIRGKDHIHLMQNISNIYDYFEQADIAFCAGGNTLHELACIGTPTIVIPTMLHETNNGKRFEERGFGITVNRTEFVSIDELSFAWKTLKPIAFRTKMSCIGKALCPGNGIFKVSEIIGKIINYER